MERLHYLVRRFHQILPEPSMGGQPRNVRELHCWLRDDVGPELESCVLRPRFREQARWPIQTLAAGAGTAERALVDRVDRALTGYAQALQTIIAEETVQRRLEKVAIQVTNREEVVICGDSSRVLHRAQSSHPLLSVLVPQLSAIAERFWQQLVCVKDYFEPTGGWGDSCRGKRPGEFVVAVNPELHPGGDFVSRCLWRRVEVLRQVLEDCRARCRAAAHSAGTSQRAWNVAEQQHQELVEASARLYTSCLCGTQQPLRDACVLLTQVHAALNPNANLDWLGVPAAAGQRGKVVMKRRLLHDCHGELFERLAGSLSVLRGLYTRVDEQQTALDEAVASGGLVVLRSQRAVYWEAERIDVNWTAHHALWRFLLALVEKGQHAAAVEGRDLHDDTVGTSTLATTFYRLKKLVPATLWRSIQSNKDPKGYRLTLNREDIFLL
ncbi:MAG: hypothetical protein AB7K24_16950 [Gemmataceae bacterium]